MDLKRHETLVQAFLWILAFLAATLAISQVLLPYRIQVAGITIDRMNAFLALLVAFIGSITLRFSIRYMDGEKQKKRFLFWLCFSVCMSFVFMLSTNLLLLLLAWTLTSVALHKLLTFYEDRAQVWAPARKKFLISRVGDLVLIAAIALIWIGYGTLDLKTFLDAVGDGQNALHAHAIAVLVALAAITKSAQFPFHSWLPETMEAPLPVSALMHAGIINAGGVLLLRFAPLLSQSEPALVLLVLIGTVTAVIGTLSMWAQVKIKRTLAWSTVSQMGFMVVQGGLCVFPAMIVHIVGHGCYKAWSFLRSGSNAGPTPGERPLSPWTSLGITGLGTLASLPALAIGSWASGFTPLHSPGELALTGIVALSIGQMWVAIYRVGGRGVWWQVRHAAQAAIATLCVSLVACVVYRVAELLFAPAAGVVHPPAGAMAWLRAGVPTLVLATLVLFRCFQQRIEQTAWGRALHIHALHGFYFGAIADRMVEQLWNAIITRKGIHSNAA